MGDADAEGEVLVAGVHELNQTLLADALTDRGYTVRRTSSTEGIMAAFSEGPDEPDILILDLDGMPEEVGHACQELSGRGVPVLALVRARTEKAETWALQHGVRMLLEKPVRHANLMVMVGSLKVA